jgi:hypothetical protein
MSAARKWKDTVLGTMLLCLLCTVIPYASGNLGYVFYLLLTLRMGRINLHLRWNAINDTCWYRSRNGATMLHWLIATQTLWMLLFAAGEVGAFVVIVGYLIAYEVCPSHSCSAVPYITRSPTDRHATLPDEHAVQEYLFVRSLPPSRFDHSDVPKYHPARRWVNQKSSRPGD